MPARRRSIFAEALPAPVSARKEAPILARQCTQPLRGTRVPTKPLPRIRSASLADVAKYVVDAHGPPSLVCADVLCDYIEEKSQSSGAQGIPFAAYKEIGRGLIYFDILGKLTDTPWDTNNGLAAISSQEQSIGEQPMWYIIDQLVMAEHETHRMQQVGSVKSLLNSGGQGDEHWHRFWQFYRKKSTSFSMRPIGATDEEDVRHLLPMATSPRRRSKPPPKSASKHAEHLLPHLYNALPLYLQGQAEIGPRLLMSAAVSLSCGRQPRSRSYRKAVQSRGPSRGAAKNLSSVSWEIIHQHQAFEMLANTHSAAGTHHGEVDEVEHDPDEESNPGTTHKKIGNWGKNANGRRGALKLFDIDSDDDRGCEVKDGNTSSGTDCRDGATGVQGTEIGSTDETLLPSEWELQKSTDTSPSSSGTKLNSLPKLVGQRREPIHCFSGFDDYKKHQKPPSGKRIEKSLREMLLVEASEPQWQWSTAMREHKTARVWRLEQQDPSSLLPSYQTTAETSPASVQIPCVSRGKPPSQNFQRPWSRAGMEKDGHADDEDALIDPLRRYAKVCLATGVHPQPAAVRFLVAESPKLDVRGAGFSDEDVLALAASLPYESNIYEVDLGENPRLTDPSVLTLVSALARRHASSLRALCMDHCHRLGREALAFCTEELRTGLMELQVLDLSGLSIGWGEYKELADAVENHAQLNDVRLAGTGLGSTDKAQAAKVVASLVGNQHLRSLDLSWNSLDVASFRTLGRGLVEHRYLSSLSLVNTGVCPDPVIGGSPLLAFLELLAGDTTLTSLDISNNGLDGTAVLVLESATRGHPSLKCVKVSNNPLGVDGMRSLLRLLASPGCPALAHLVADDCQGAALATQFNGPFEVDPSGFYHLDLERPADRALLRLLLMRVSDSAGGGAVSFAQCVKRGCLRKQGVETPFHFESLRKKARGIYEVPVSGVLEFELSLDEVVLRSVQEGWASHQVVDHLIRQSRALLDDRQKQLGVLSFVKTSVSQAAHGSLLVALSCDFVLTAEQVKALCYTEVKEPLGAKDTVGSLGRLLPCLVGVGNAGIRQALSCASGLTNLMAVGTATSQMLSLDLENPTAHYQLNFREPADRSTAERLLMHNRWQFKVWRDSGRIDISQLGNGKNFRNVMVNGRNFTLGPEEWRLSSCGVDSMLEFDYVSLSRPPKGAQPVSDETWQLILGVIRQQLKRPSVAQCTNLDAQAKASVLAEVNKVLDERVHGVGKKLGADLEAVVITASQALDLSEQDVLWSLRATSSKFWITCSQLRDLLGTFLCEQVRCSLLVSFFPRCTDWPINSKMCRPKFSASMWNDIRKRVGYINLFPFLQPETVFFPLDLSVPEQRRILHALVKLQQAEHVSNLKKPRIDWKGGSSKPNWDTFMSGIPLSWDDYSAIPARGLFEATYMCSMENVRLSSRRRLAAGALGGWMNLPEKTLELASAVVWWSVLDEVPQEVVRVLVFLVTRWLGLPEAFDACDRNHDGKLNHKEFVGALKAAGCAAPVKRTGTAAVRMSEVSTDDSKPVTPNTGAKKIPRARAKSTGPSGDLPVKEDGADQQDQLLTTVYRFLDSSNDGDISKKEFELLAGIWRELWQSCWEYKVHLSSCFGSLAMAWELGDKDGDGYLCYSEFQRLANISHFVGPLRQIFMYLDADGDERILKQEWMHLERIGTEVKKPAW